ncbi:MAG TPA: hypothetical protein VFF52_03785 [Isosphaeraceae bacterium]|nr:hypothetical protein [Isosphaeraceae bacterium]
MVDLVFWSFVVALTPVVLGSAWKLILGTLHGIALRLSLDHGGEVLFAQGATHRSEGGCNRADWTLAG